MQNDDPSLQNDDPSLQNDDSSMQNESPIGSFCKLVQNENRK